MKFEHFDIEEFYCQCGREHQQQQVDERLVLMLDIARSQAGVSFVISSGYRCIGHNKEVGGVADSSHLKGLAVDIRVQNSRSRFLILRSLIDVGFRRIGVAKNFIHVDIDSEKDLGVCWDYYGR